MIYVKIMDDYVGRTLRIKITLYFKYANSPKRDD